MRGGDRRYVISFALYETGQEEKYAWYETSLPVSAQMECDIPLTDGFFLVKQVRTQTMLEPREDLDGELRNLAAECSMEVELLSGRRRRRPFYSMPIVWRESYMCTGMRKNSGRWQ